MSHLAHEILRLARTNRAAFLFAFTIGLLIVLPVISPLPYEFNLGDWASPAGGGPALGYRYDAIAHLFVFVIVCLTVSSLSLGRPSTCLRRNLLATGVALFATLNLLTVRSVVILYVVWEMIGFARYLRAHRTQVPESSSRESLWCIHLPGFGLLALAIVVASTGASFRNAPDQVLPTLPLLFLLLITVGARANLFPFHNARADDELRDRWAGAFSSLLAAGSCILMIRILAMLGGSWPSQWQSLSLQYALFVVMMCGLLAWRSSPSLRTIRLAFAADHALVLTAFVIATPDAVGAGILLLLNNSLALPAVMLARPVSSARLSSPSIWSRAVSFGALIGAPPLLGFTARWMLFAALWADTNIIPLILISLFTLPRTIALMRASGSLTTRDQEVSPKKNVGAVLPLLPAALLAVFGLVPWLPYQLLVAPALLAIFGPEKVPSATNLLSTSLGSNVLVAALTAATLLSLLSLSVFFASDQQPRAPRAGHLIRMPLALKALLGIVGEVCRVSLDEALDLAETALQALVRRLSIMLQAIEGFLDVVSPPIQERYYLAAVSLFGVVVILFLVGQ